MYAKAPTAQQLKNLTGDTLPTYRTPVQGSLGVAEALDAIDRTWGKLLSEAKMAREDFTTYISHTAGFYSAAELFVYKDVFNPYVDAATQLAKEVVWGLYKAHPTEYLQIMELHREAERGMSRALEHPNAPSFVPIYIQTVMDKFQELREKLLAPGRYVKKLMTQQNQQ